MSAHQGAAQDCKENIKQEVVKEEDNSNTESASQIKEEPNSGVCTKKEGEEDTEVINLQYLVDLNGSSVFCSIQKRLKMQIKIKLVVLQLRLMLKRKQV